LQSVVNTLREFGVVVSTGQLSSRNVAAVMVTATLPPFARPGDKLDVNVSSMGDARSLVGATLLMTPLHGPDRRIYALAQGSLAVGGYMFDLNGNVVQRNHPTAGVISEGAIVEAGVASNILRAGGTLDFVLFQPDHTTSSRVAAEINRNFGTAIAHAADAGRVSIMPPEQSQNNLVDFVASLEKIAVEPDNRARVVVNERTGTVVAGGDVRISKVSVTQGDLRVSIVTDYLVSQPEGGLFRPSPSIRTQTVPLTRVDVNDGQVNNVSLPAGTTVDALVTALNQIKTNTRDVIAVLQAVKRAGALHAELIVQ
jgi:flagellar P-ring protein precursor FlgI